MNYLSFLYFIFITISLPAVADVQDEICDLSISKQGLYVCCPEEYQLDGIECNDITEDDRGMQCCLQTISLDNSYQRIFHHIKSKNQSIRYPNYPDPNILPTE